MRNFDKSLTEVWEWKDKVYQDTKNMTAAEYAEKVRKDVDKELETNAIALQAVHKEKQLV